MPLWIKEAAGQPYMPSNGTEGACFHEMHCANCERDKVMNGTATIEEADGDMTMLCEILGRSFREDELAEWKFGPDGWPMCTAFVPMGEKIPAARKGLAMQDDAATPMDVGSNAVLGVTTATPADELKAAVSSAYGRGYYAGQRRKKQQISAEVKQRQESAMWHRYMQAALSACVNAENWKAGDKPIINVAGRTKLAADFADEAVKLARQRCRL